MELVQALLLRNYTSERWRYCQKVAPPVERTWPHWRGKGGCTVRDPLGAISFEGEQTAGRAQKDD